MIHPAHDRPVGSLADLHGRIVDYYAPPSVLVNDELDVVHVGHDAGKFLTIGDGEPTRQILRLVHPALRFDLRGATPTRARQRRDEPPMPARSGSTITGRHAWSSCACAPWRTRRSDAARS